MDHTLESALYTQKVAVEERGLEYYIAISGTVIGIVVGIDKLFRRTPKCSFQIMNKSQYRNSRFFIFLVVHLGEEMVYYL
jgi:hypothetical protein